MPTWCWHRELTSDWCCGLQVAPRSEVTGWTGMTDSQVWIRMCWKSVCPVVLAPRARWQGSHQHQQASRGKVKDSAQNIYRTNCSCNRLHSELWGNRVKRKALTWAEVPIRTHKSVVLSDLFSDDKDINCNITHLLWQQHECGSCLDYNLMWERNTSLCFIRKWNEALWVIKGTWGKKQTNSTGSDDLSHMKSYSEVRCKNCLNVVKDVCIFKSTQQLFLQKQIHPAASSHAGHSGAGGVNGCVLVNVGVFWSELNDRLRLLLTLDGLHGDCGFVERDGLLRLRSAGTDGNQTDGWNNRLCVQIEKSGQPILAALVDDFGVFTGFLLNHRETRL